MNLIFMRHGEASNNVKEYLSDKEIYWSLLTIKGQNEVKESIKSLPTKLDKIYTSLLPRTIQTAHFVYEKYKSTEIIIENRLREISYGKYSGQQNNEELDNIRKKQIEGDYFTRFGDYGENKLEIENRLSSFLAELSKNNAANSTILIISHGSVTSYMKRILKLKTPHLKTGKIEEFKNVNFTPVYAHLKTLKSIEEKK